VPPSIRNLSTPAGDAVPFFKRIEKNETADERKKDDNFAISLRLSFVHTLCTLLVVVLAVGVCDVITNE